MTDEDPMRRLRGHAGRPPGWTRGGERSTVWFPDKRGPLICSRMAYRSGDQHAPVFDVDLPLVAVRQACGGSGLVLTGLLGPSALRRLWRGLPFLGRYGFVREENAVAVRAQLRNVMDGDPDGRLVLPLTCRTRAVPSANPQHRHLYVDTVMTFSASVRLARALGFVDPDHVALSRRLAQWQVRLAWRPAEHVEPPRPARPAYGRATARVPAPSPAPLPAEPIRVTVPAPREGREPTREPAILQTEPPAAV